MMDLVSASRADTVFHLASLFLAQHRSADIDAMVTANVLFATQLVEAMAIAGCNRLVNIGTSWQHHAGDGYNPVNLYAATKQAFDDILRYYLEVTPIRATTLTLFDTYGPGDHRKKLIALLRDAALTGTPLQMSPGEQLVDLVYIDDVVAALQRAAELLQTQDSFHTRYRVSCGDALSLRHLVATIERVSGRKLSIAWGGRPYRPREVMLPSCPYPLLPGWSPLIPLDQGIARVISGGP
jgi:nucleoside-diphosphate-sugar epimerase